MRLFSRNLSGREIRLLCYLALLLAFVGYWFLWRARWSGALTFTTEHYTIQSTATATQVREIGEVAEVLFLSYSNFFGAFPQVVQPHPKFRMKLYKDRAEFRRCNPGIGWAEAFYRYPCCHAYYSSQDINSTHWMLHEAVHQLNAETAQFELPQWLNEGLATYFSTSVLTGKRLRLGTIDPNTYPVWWLDDLATSGKLKTDLQNGTIIPLHAIITGNGGPSLNKQFNLYYLHWWTLTHFLLHFEDGKYRAGFFMFIQRKGPGLKDFETHIGPISRIQEEWYRHVQELKSSMSKPRRYKSSTSIP